MKAPIPSSIPERISRESLRIPSVFIVTVIFSVRVSNTESSGASRACARWVRREFWARVDSVSQDARKGSRMIFPVVRAAIGAVAARVAPKARRLRGTRELRKTPRVRARKPEL